MFVSNGNGFAVPVSTKKTSTSETSQKDISDELDNGANTSVETAGKVLYGVLHADELERM